MMNDKIELRAAAARLLYGNNRDSADYDMLVDYIDSREPVQHWIPCSERLPNMFETVLVAYEDCDGELVYGISERFQFVGQKRIRWSSIAGNTPSHWMPLPEPPEIK